MEKIKTVLDRQPLSSEYIGSKQDFGKVMKGVNGIGTPIWKSTWFYGTVGVAAVAIIVAAVTLTDSNTPKDQASLEVTTATSMLEKDQKDRQEAAHKTITVQKETAPQPKEVVATSTPAPVKPKVKEPVEAKQPTPQAKVVAAKVVPEEVAPELTMPNISGVSTGSIAFKEFCNPLGIQVGNGILIHNYTIRYRSCARDVTARVKGNRIPKEVCEEIRDCGNNIEIFFTNIEGRQRDDTWIRLKDFSLVTTL